LNDIAASFQVAVVKALKRNLERALKNFEVKSISVAGGVAANKALREAAIVTADKHKKKIVIPSDGILRR